MKKNNLLFAGVLVSMVMIGLVAAQTPVNVTANQGVPINTVQINLGGLNKAVTVANQNALPRINLNLQALSTKDTAILRALNDVSINASMNNQTIDIKGKAPAKLFGFIPLQHTERYTLNAHGTLTRVHGLLDFLWKG